jgi:hypothetical protein
MKLTRRQLAAAIAAAPLASASPAAPLPQAPAAPAQPPAGDLQTARDRIAANSKALAAVRVPMSTEPAVVFKA